MVDYNSYLWLRYVKFKNIYIYLTTCCSLPVKKESIPIMKMNFVLETLFRDYYNDTKLEILSNLSEV